MIYFLQNVCFEIITLGCNMYELIMEKYWKKKQKQ